ncbi:MAG: glucose-6-phosphate isomerase [Desulfovibrio sp.]|uniref:glucose-6-phosphate isomerase n=1 Tax=Desulfovibrio sp. 7SRBS1 TaxID=3378064 RepID=UPI003B3E808F
MTTFSIDWTNADFNDLNCQNYQAKARTFAGRLADSIADGELPFVNLPYMDLLLRQLDDMKEYLSNFEHMLLLGIGGSALGARALQKAFFPQQDRPGHKGPWLWVNDNVDPAALQGYFDTLPPEKTVVVVISKSGGTIETASQYILAKEWLRRALGEDWKDNILAVTDAENGELRSEVEELGMQSLPVPDNLGGRYSVLSAVGLVPAVFLGLDYRRIALGAHDAAKELCAAKLTEKSLNDHPAWKLAVWNRALMESGYTELIFFSYIPMWATFGNWFAQLWAESLGKEGKGSMPLPSVGVTDQHSVNQMYLDGPRNKACLFLTCTGLDKGMAFPDTLPDKFAFLKGRQFGELLQAEALGTRMALTKTGVPLVALDAPTAGLYDAGKLIMLLELTTLLTGWLLDINPLDQPAVELGKRLANARLEAEGYAEEKADLKAFLEGERTIQEI